MAKEAHEKSGTPAPFQAHAPAHEVGHAATPAAAAAKAEKGTHVVTFPGQPAVTVTAASDEEAVTKAAEQLGVVSSEKPPDVVKVS